MDTTTNQPKPLTIFEIADDPELWEAYGAEIHRERYPDGCRGPHSCEQCIVMVPGLAATQHTAADMMKVGARRGYKGHWECRRCY